MKSRTGGPNFHRNAATTKNRSPRATAEAATEAGTDSPAEPERMAMTLNGNGVTPAIRTAQAPQPL